MGASSPACSHGLDQWCVAHATVTVGSCVGKIITERGRRRMKVARPFRSTVRSLGAVRWLRSFGHVRHVIAVELAEAYLEQSDKREFA